MPAKRYRWGQKSEVYHDTFYSVERCNIDDMEGYEESDELPQSVVNGRYRRLCHFCWKHKEEVAASEG